LGSANGIKNKVRPQCGKTIGESRSSWTAPEAGAGYQGNKSNRKRREGALGGKREEGIANHYVIAWPKTGNDNRTGKRKEGSV